MTSGRARRPGEPFTYESQFQGAVIELAHAMGLLAYHTHRSDRSEPGFPDLVLVGGRGVLYRELKMEKTKASEAQLRWIEGLTLAGQNAGIWRPEHYPKLISAEMSSLGRLPTHVLRVSMTQEQARAHLQRHGRIQA